MCLRRSAREKEVVKCLERIHQVSLYTLHMLIICAAALPRPQCICESHAVDHSLLSNTTGLARGSTAALYRNTTGGRTQVHQLFSSITGIPAGNSSNITGVSSVKRQFSRASL